ncbi:MAG: cation:proton antiporter [Planctomycetaceae bacterium]|nr:cation:proton antiporter [Planctomycetaceae bacterium]
MILASAIDTEAFLLQIIMQLVIIIGAARLGGWLLARWGQPQVVGEIATGLLLGPSCLGRLNPELSGILFPAETSSSLLLLGQLGLILLMFIIGLEFDFGWLKKTGKTAAAVATCGMVLPFTLGALLAWSLHARLAAEHSLPGFVLFTATALSITAIPILGRIMMEFQITRTALGVLTISAAAIDDALGWILLATVSSGIHGDFSLLPMTIMLGKTILFILAIAFLVRPLCFWWLNRVIRQDQQELSLPAFSFILILVLLSAAEIGRATCRGRQYISETDELFKKKHLAPIPTPTRQHHMTHSDM